MINTEQADQHHSRNRLEAEYLSLCDFLEREATPEGFLRFRNEPELRRQMRDRVRDLRQQQA